jgi:hypothetical protein
VAVVPAGTVIENDATSARATKQTAAAPAQQGATAPAPMVQGTVIEGSAVIARAQKKTAAGQAPLEGPPTTVLPAGTRSGAWMSLGLLRAGGIAVGGLGLLTLVVVLLWPKGGDQVKSGKEHAASGTQKDGHRDAGKKDKNKKQEKAKEQRPRDKQQPLPPPGPVLADTKDGKPGVVAKFRTSGTYQVVFTPDGLRAITRWHHGGNVWDLVDFVQRPKDLGFEQTLSNDPRKIAFAPDGKRFIVPGGTSAQRYNGKTYKEQKPPIGLYGACTAVAFSPDSKVVATAEMAAGGSRIRFWGAEDRAVVKKDIRVKDPILTLGFSPDGQFLALSTGSLDMSFVNTSGKKIFIYRYEDGKLERALDGHPKSASPTAYFADGKRLLSASPYDGTLRVWNIDDGKEVRKIQAGTSLTHAEAWRSSERIAELKEPEAMVGLAFWPWGRALVARLDGSLQLWDVDTGKKVGNRIESLSENAHSFAMAMAISPDGHHALVCYNDSNMYLYRLPPPMLGKNP